MKHPGVISLGWIGGMFSPRREGSWMPDRMPLSQRIARDLRMAIESGELPPGWILPSERELIAKYATSKSTASKAIALLQAEGLVTTEFGKGTFVRRRPPLRRVS